MANTSGPGAPAPSALPLPCAESALQVSSEGECQQSSGSYSSSSVGGPSSSHLSPRRSIAQNRQDAASSNYGDPGPPHPSNRKGDGGGSACCATGPAVVIEDDGADHATDEEMEHEHNSEGWRPQSEETTCEFYWDIEGYSDKRESGCKKAEYSGICVDEAGNKWRLIIYVNGNGKSSNNHLSLFLQVADSEELPFGWKKNVSYVLTLEHPANPKLSYAKRNPDKTFKLCPKAIDWGWSQFITSDRIQQEGYVHRDALRVKAVVTVKSSSVAIDPADAELYLKCAVEEGSYDAVRACLEQGASVNCQFKDDLYTPLHTACSSMKAGSIDVLNLLLGRDADCNAVNKWLETPLLIAANNGHYQAVEALLRHGADPSLCSEAGWSALTFAAHKGYEDIVELLLNRGAPVNCRVTEDLSTPLHKACAGNKHGHIAAVRMLLEHEADVHALNKWKETPLLTAANNGQAAAVEALLDYGADACLCTDTGWSPLSIAAYKGHNDVVRLLLEEGAPTEEADPTLSALLQAATKGLPDTVVLLLQHGANHNVTTKKGDTALSILVEQDKIDAAVKMVTKYKASIPRCSRDRKKVQRARLLINLQLKKQRREGNNYLDSDDDLGSEDEAQSAEDVASALHSDEEADLTGSREAPGASRKKIGKKKKNGGGIVREKSPETQEAESLAAAEALLAELEVERAKALREEAATSKKAARKKKKKERQREKEDQVKRVREEEERQAREKKEQERDRKLKEERVSKEKERKEREKKEAQEREEALTRKLREKEERENKILQTEAKEREKQKREIQSQSRGKSGKDDAGNSSCGTFIKKEKNIAANQQSQHKALQHPPGKNGLKHSTGTTPSKPPGNKRGWETPRPSPILPPHPAPQAPPLPKHSVKTSAASALSSSSSSLVPAPVSIAARKSSSSVEAQLENMAFGVVDFLGFDSPAHKAFPNGVGNVSSRKNSAQKPINGLRDDSTGAPDSLPLPSQHSCTSSLPTPSKSENTGGSVLNNQAPVQTSVKVTELPAVSVFREIKFQELIRNCDPNSVSDQGHNSNSSTAAPLSRSIGISAAKLCFFRWCMRAAHSSNPYLDPLIPSWRDEEALTSFFQRQLITISMEDRKLVNSEELKEAGASLASICLNLAKEVASFGSSHPTTRPSNWSDYSEGMSAMESLHRTGVSIVSITCDNLFSVHMLSSVFESFKRGYRGDTNRFLSAVFCTLKRYDTLMSCVTACSYMDYSLAPSTLLVLSQICPGAMEARSNPMLVFGENSFCGLFPDVDDLFGGLPAFAKEGGGGGETALIQHGGSFIILPPCENIVTGLYLRRIYDVLESNNNTCPLSFTIFLPAQCFRDTRGSPTISDLSQLEPRFVNSEYVRRVEGLNPGQHCYRCGDGLDVTHCGSLLVVVQNDMGALHIHFSDDAISSIVLSMSPGLASLDVTNSTTQWNMRGRVGDTKTSSTAVLPSAPVPSLPVTASGPIVGTDVSSVGGTIIGHYANGRRQTGGRRGRLFDLVDDGEDDVPTTADLSGMLGGLNVGMFSNGADVGMGAQEVDIEAISLMGIGGAGAGSAQANVARTFG